MTEDMKNAAKKVFVEETLAKEREEIAKMKAAHPYPELEDCFLLAYKSRSYWQKFKAWMVSLFPWERKHKPSDYDVRLSEAEMARRLSPGYVQMFGGTKRHIRKTA